MRHTHLGILALITLSGCSGTNTVTTNSGLVTVTGTVVAYEDAVPVDGGVTLTVEAKDGAQTDFYLPSFFTPEPVEGNWEIYQTLNGIQVGDEVRIEGEHTEYGVSITAVNRL